MPVEAGKTGLSDGPRKSANRFDDDSCAATGTSDSRSADGQRISRGNGEFAAVTAEYLRLLQKRILEREKLQNAPSEQSRAGGSAHSNRSHDAIAPPCKQIDIGGQLIDLNVGTRVGHRGFIFAGAEPEQYTTWYVFATAAMDELEQQSFVFRGSLSGLAPSKTFVEQAYGAVLGREPDIEGRDIYMESLENGNLSRADLLQTFLGSEEMRLQQQTVIILPAPSRWFSPRLSPAIQ